MPIRLIERLLLITLLTVVALTFVWFVIGKIYYSSNSEQMNSTYTLLGGRKPVRNSDSSNSETSISTNEIEAQIQIPNSFPQVGVLTNDILYKTPLSDFVWLEKTDGLHYNLIIFDNCLYAVIHGKLEKLQELPITFAKQTILDSELYEGKFYIFDCPMIENKDISEQPFTERMEAANQFIQSHPELNDKFEVKKFYNVNTNELIKLLKTINTTTKSPITGNKIDGVVFQNVNLPYYYDKGNIVFKLKRRALNTVDFKLIYDNDENIYYLYLLGSYIHVLFNRKKLPKTNIKSEQHVGVDLKQKELPKKPYVLFASPYFEDLHLFNPDMNFNTHGYFEDEIVAIRSLTQQMLDNPTAFNNKIVEMSLTEDNVWVPLRVRTDKLNSNGYDVGLSNCSVMFNPITEDSIKDSSLYFTKSKQLFFDETITNPYHEINRLIRQYIIEHSINHTLTRKLKPKESLTVLDLAGGRGADELELYHCGATNIFAMDADKTALVQYVDRTPFTPRIKGFKFLLKESVEPRDLRKSIFINAVYGFLNINDEAIENDIKTRFEYPVQIKSRTGNVVRAAGFDVILMNYAIHYLCDDMRKISELHRFVVSMLRPGGLFIFSCFDGDEILRLIHEHNGNVSAFHIELVNQTNDNDASSHVYIAKMPLPTIDASGYREEPLCTKECLSVFMNSDQLEPVEQYEPLKAIKGLEQYRLITDKNKVADFLQFIRVYVFRRK